MLFNSFEFLFLFLPVTLAVFFALGRTGRTVAAETWLLVVSVLFYAWWDWRNLPILTLSIAVNFLIGRRLALFAAIDSPALRRTWLIAGIGANLTALGYFKYAAFLADGLVPLVDMRAAAAGIELPLGISFFTFTQTAFLIDAYRRQVCEANPLHYGLFVTYFPHLIAGPILHHKDMMPQFAEPETYRIRPHDLAVGLTVFAIGLFKKVGLADHVAPTASAVFEAARDGTALTLGDAWLGALCYTLQIYFDFSGYSDMALGLARVIGVRFPLNFNSPYQALSIVDFWRRWHMTLSRFLRDYLYFPLGGNRRGSARRHVNLMLTMLLGGLWHGANWTFVIWGGLHGLYLMVNHAWHGLQDRMGRRLLTGAGGRLVAGTLTFVAVMVAWVFFRADSVVSAGRVLTAMAGLDQLRLPRRVADLPGAGWLEAHGVQFGAVFSEQVVTTPLETSALAALLLLICWLMPNTQRIVPEIALDPRDESWRWRPVPSWAAVVGLMLAAGILGMSQVSEFIYFNF
ncbi:MBOAT family O-acyltransferase [Magnetospirillum moscoviense]|uniref:Probable alginate O-acetylase AlgI n=1 Tax=Magnetospirillum moscoviense TaxID=1437059 RepID=A0A178MW99_9PROT|nr:MBOAT family protein [Magnetospirillum moscoviense]OAN54991.1 hypothetical protein A6A05_00070 [Magnetospirillum moscoviense]